MFRLAKGLRAAGVLGINRRNAEYTLRCNPRRLYPLVDDKLLTKQLAQAAGIAVPPLYAAIEIERQIRELPRLLEPYASFVVKPAQGSGGNGIVVITGRSRQMYRRAGGSVISHDELAYHISNILNGLYSLGGYRDKAMIEYRVQFDPVFDAISYQGVPDIRIIVYYGVPVMAMLRLPTRVSQGRANLHQGALGAGIDIATGRTLGAVWGRSLVDEHPETGNRISGLAIPGWDSLLSLAARCHGLTNLGYQGVDIVLDKDLGPLILEINVRPGLNIQIANRAGLRRRLEKVDEALPGLCSLQDKVAFARREFAMQ